MVTTADFHQRMYHRADYSRKLQRDQGESAKEQLPKAREKMESLSKSVGRSRARLKDLQNRIEDIRGTSNSARGLSEKQKSHISRLHKKNESLRKQLVALVDLIESTKEGKRSPAKLKEKSPDKRKPGRNKTEVSLVSQLEQSEQQVKYLTRRYKELQQNITK